MIARYYPGAGSDRYEITNQILDEKIEDNDIIIEAGCGHHGMEFYEKARRKTTYRLIGVDISGNDILENKQIDAGVVADVGQMPFKNESINKIVSRMVVEHLEHPEVFFKEVSRILKPQGCFIIMTPSKSGLVTLGSRLIPNSLHPWLVQKLTRIPERDVHPTYYRANTIKCIDRLANKWNMHRDRYITCQPPPFAFVFSRTICLLTIIYFKVIDKFECLSFLRGVIIARYIKAAHPRIDHPTKGINLSVCHVISGDLWAGAECQVVNLLSGMVETNGIVFSAITFNPGRLTSELEKMGVNVTCLPEETLSSPGILFGIRKHLKKHTPDVIHCHGHKEHILGCLASLLSGGRPKTVRTLHGMPEPFSGSARIRAAFFDKAQDFCMRYLTEKIVVVSQDMRRRLSERPWAEKMACIHNGIDLNRVRATVSRDEMRRRLGIKNGDFVIGTACRLVPIKRIDLLLETFQMVRQNHPQTLLVICGDGPLRSELQESAKILGVFSHVKFLGHRDDIYNVMSTFDIFAMSSEHEGIPMVLLEALALGIPLLVPDVGGIPEVAQGTDAKLYEPLSIQNLGDNLLEQISKYPEKPGANASVDEHILDRISVRLTTEKVIHLYEKLKA
jgi:glycosyltransferase involved in cell wall biosynthesis/ubiquinone/menaquinone biosynthesis C-methylase UbiE